MENEDCLPAGRQGFTLIELLIVIGIIAIVSSFAVINLIRPQTKASLDSTLTPLVSDIKEQQLKAMVGDGSGSTPSAYGIYFETNKYTIFKGNTYSLSDTNNFIVNLQGDTSITNTFTSNQIVFSQRSGEVVGFSSPNNTLTISSGGDSKTITVNALGNININ
jgi:prepilin-type N-terminal cleavage/methylation domain-containing protein